MSPPRDLGPARVQRRLFLDEGLAPLGPRRRRRILRGGRGGRLRVGAGAAALLCSIFRPKSSNACFRGSGNCCGLSSQAMGDRGSSYCASGNTLPINCLLFGTLIVFNSETSVATEFSCDTFDPST